MVRFFCISVVHALVIWIFCFVFQLDAVLVKVTPRALKEFVSDENCEETRLQNQRKPKTSKLFKAFLQMTVVEVLAAPVLVTLSLGLAYSGDY